MLDLVFTSLNCSVSRSDFSLVAEDLMHPTLLLDIAVPVEKGKCASSVRNSKLNFRRADFTNLYASILATDWSRMTSFTDVNAMCDCFYTLLMESIKAHVPYSKSKRNSFPSCYTPELIREMKLKEHARRYYIQHKSDHTCTAYSTMRSGKDSPKFHI